ncbi:YbhB/YbcL family Raf kinase inhibitor-like protein [Halomonas getboli]|uniref:YbhB/YbcL family Raf kinase inhibitor-like protein n=1 Tax=Halomonas getboli TaxID=2935862 RepID=UPI001FFFC3FF|nr:YbhB/YbcL family Raf kinase inhibitor-like protein [Halomonas getboli]MCK2182418.1 YbhB/YbcL family Raf kinase inhibitor-like protein [Halomonas getboli]
MAFALSKMQVTSSAFDNLQPIPAKYTGEGDDVSPPLAWENPPEGTKGYAVICHDPDAPLVEHGHYGFVHWLVYNLPASVTSLEEASARGTRGRNNFQRNDYGGPMPPEGHGTHLYYYMVLALDKPTDLPEGISMDELLKQIEPHLLGMNRLIGTYQRD